MMAWLKDLRIKRSLILSGLLLTSASVSAQDAPDYSAIEKNMDAFSTVLRENLGLDGSRSGNFNPFANMSNAYYLAGQGVVIELNTQLSRSRATIGMRSLGTTLQQLADNFAQRTGRGPAARG
ncbi:MAG: hypothetical protein R3332_06070, partial [Pseudohongiellaceae bacterium]|nr:hypothetical protein [Pseudohongiellaceae bacterium]